MTMNLSLICKVKYPITLCLSMSALGVSQSEMTNQILASTDWETMLDHLLMISNRIPQLREFLKILLTCNTTGKKMIQIWINIQKCMNKRAVLVLKPIAMVLRIGWNKLKKMGTLKNKMLWCLHQQKMHVNFSFLKAKMINLMRVIWKMK